MIFRTTGMNNRSHKTWGFCFYLGTAHIAYFMIVRTKSPAPQGVGHLLVRLVSILEQRIAKHPNQCVRNIKIDTLFTVIS